MRRFAAMCAAAAIALMVMACNQSPDNHDADVKAIQHDEAQWNQDFVSKDADKLLSHYADDAILMGPGMPASSGKDSINIVKEMVFDPAMTLKFHPSKVEIAKSGDMAYTQGSYTMTMTDPQSKQVLKDHGSYVTTYRKQPDGTWKAVADIAISEVPLAASALAPANKNKPLTYPSVASFTSLDRNHLVLRGNTIALSVESIHAYRITVIRVRGRIT
jgi:uncharacterized protein (TIGR02246 family)